MPISEVFNQDCIEGMKQYPDKFFDLAIVDPPYGIGMDKNAGKSKQYKKKDWDSCSPDIEYFKELIRVSKNQVIWGANHFIDKISINSPCWIVWDKRETLIDTRTYADCELAWKSFKSPTRIFRFYWDGFLQKEKEDRIHPTQKPKALYKWILDNYAQSGNKILDTHLGSQSSRIAAHEMGFDFWGYELDKDYFDTGNKRFADAIKQQSLFSY